MTTRLGAGMPLSERQRALCGASFSVQWISGVAAGLAAAFIASPAWRRKNRGGSVRACVRSYGMGERRHRRACAGHRRGGALWWRYYTWRLGAAGVGDCGNYRAGGCADAHRAAVALARLLSHAAGGLQTIALAGVVVAAGVAVGAGEVALVLPAAGAVATGAALAALPAAAAVAP